MPSMSKPRVLLTNDDGPPHPRESPYVLGLYQHLTEHLGWDVKVVLPSSQKSWIGKAYFIKEVVKGWYFYPKQDGEGESSDHSRSLRSGEIAEWILLDATPATCANIALHNLYAGQIDLVISGPNLGRNSSAAFALSSGTIGAALSSSLSRIRSIALSYGTVLHPTPVTFFEPAHHLSAKILQYLWSHWGQDDGGLRAGEVDLYNVNVPLVEALLSKEGLKICSTTMWRNSYGSLFKTIPNPDTVLSVGPDPLDSAAKDMSSTKGYSQNLFFKFGPNMGNVLTPPISSLPIGSDGWAIHHGWVSVTPLRACFGEPPQEQEIDVENRVWKMKL